MAALMFWTEMVFALLLFMLLLLVTCHVVQLQYRRWKYRHLPSPKMLSHWSSYFVGHGNLFEKVRHGQTTLKAHTLNWVSELGPVFVVHLPSNSMIFLATKEAVKEFVVSGKHFKHPPSYAKIGYILSERFVGRGLVAESDDTLWEPKRRLFNPAFHRNYLKLSMDQFNQSTEDFIKWVTPKADGKTPVAMLEDLTRLTIDVIAKVGFGFDSKSMTEKDSKFRDTVHCILRAQTKYERNPWKKYSIHPDTIADRRNVRSAVRFLRKAGEDIITSRIEDLKNNGDTRNDILSYILKASERDGQLAMVELVDEFVTFFLAGNETTANTLAALLLHLSCNPEVMTRLQEEVKLVLGKRTYIEFEDLPKLEYMAAVIKETLRINPPIGGTARVASFDVVVNGHLIPKGTTLMLSPLTHITADYFPDPMNFKPERFLGEYIEPHTYMPFAVGPRSCIGQQFAMMEMKVILSKLLQAFHLTWVPGQSYDFINETTTKPKDGALHYLRVKSHGDQWKEWE